MIFLKLTRCLLLYVLWLPQFFLTTTCFSVLATAFCWDNETVEIYGYWIWSSLFLKALIRVANFTVVLASSGSNHPPQETNSFMIDQVEAIAISSWKHRVPGISFWTSKRRFLVDKVDKLNICLNFASIVRRFIRQWNFDYFFLEFWLASGWLVQLQLIQVNTT